MTMFRKLFDMLNPKAPEERPYGLTQGQVAELRGWWSDNALYLELLDKRSTMYGEALLAAPTTEKMWEMRGYIMGLRAAGLLVDEILQKEKELSDNGRRRSTERIDDHRITALYGTPGWS
jgi:hypothetical protein